MEKVEVRKFTARFRFEEHITRFDFRLYEGGQVHEKIEVDIQPITHDIMVWWGGKHIDTISAWRADNETMMIYRAIISACFQASDIRGVNHLEGKRLDTVYNALYDIVGEDYL